MNIAYMLRRILSSLFYALDLLTGRTKNATIVLCYHSFDDSQGRYAVSIEEFKNQINKLSRHVNFISISDLGKQIKSSKPNVLITIDDGLVSVLNIKKFINHNHIPVALFILSDPDMADREQLDTKEKLLNWDQIKMLQKSGWNIGSHSATHPNFYKLDKHEVINEIIKSKSVIYNKLKTKIDIFAYPKGSYTDKTVQAVKSAGYRYAFSIDAGTTNHSKDTFTIPRTVIDQTHRAADFPGILSPSWMVFRQLTNKYKLWERFIK